MQFHVLNFMAKKDELLIRAKVMLDELNDVHNSPRIKMWLNDYMAMARGIDEQKTYDEMHDEAVEKQERER